MEFKQFKRKGLSEMITIAEFKANGGDMTGVSVSQPDQELAVNNPQEFDKGYIARNPENHEDLWYVAKDYFDKNLEPYFGHEGKTAFAAPSDPYHRLRIGLGTFWEAGAASKAEGFKMARKGWNGANMWVTWAKGNPSLPAESFWNKHSREFAEQNGGTAPVGSYWLFKSAQGTIEMGWRPTSMDMDAEDWMIID